MKHLNLIKVLAIISLMLLVSCATAQKNTYRTLSISKVTYETAMEIAGDLYSSGTIDDCQKDEIIALATTYQSAHNQAVLAFQKANNSDLFSDQQDYLTKLSKASELLSNLILYLKPYIE
jgi:hypothetical protein